MNKLQIEQARAMLRLQADMNSTVNPDWLDAGYPFVRAVVVETAEALDHVGWKWWKRQDIDIEQVRVELVDILHFYLSAVLVRENGDTENAARFLVESSGSYEAVQFDGNEYTPSELDLLELLELMAGLAVSRRLQLSLLEASLIKCSLDWNETSKIYISKNVLNIFRQKHGYKEGSYIKIWHGYEDNVHLVNLANEINLSSEDYPRQLYAALEEKYSTVLIDN